MKRKSLVFLRQWAVSRDRKPLILRGARQVGKSTLVRLFCAEQELQLVEINLEKTKLQTLKNDENFSIQAVVDEIETITKVKLGKESLLFLDEIQDQPIALNRLRYFYEDLPHQKVIAAGSLLEVALEQEKFSMPVGRVEYHHLGPMTFLEFLEARGESVLAEKIQALSLDVRPNEALHKTAVQFLKEYFFVGGMPAAVNEFSESRNFENVRAIQLSIIEAYRDDIPKYTKNKQGERVLALFDYIPAHLGEDKVKYSDIINDRTDLIKNAVDLLTKAGVIHQVLNNTCSGIPLSSFANTDSIKLYFLDVGLYNAMTGITFNDLLYLEPDKLMTRGKIAEQFIAQHLAFRHAMPIQNHLYYWLRHAKKGAAEVDFIIAENSNILAIEVKSGTTGKMRSLQEFMLEKRLNRAVRFDLKIRASWVTKIEVEYKNQTLKYDLLGIPLYAVEKLIDFISTASR